MVEAALTRHFSLVGITWKIRNVSLSVCPLRMAVNSDEFQISGPVDTIWRLTLSISHEQNAAIAYLKMLGPDLDSGIPSGRLTKFKVHWKSNILDSNGEQSLTSERLFYFHARDNVPVEAFTLSNIIDNLSHTGPDKLTLRCSILIDHGDRVEIPGNVPSGLIELSNTLVQLPTEGLFPDVGVNVGTLTFFLHKAMFRYIKGIRRLIKMQKSFSFTLLNYDATSTDYLIRYIYSGNLNYAIAVPKIRIAEDIERSGIPELRGAYPKELMDLESIVEVRMITSSWRIENASLIEETLNGPQLREDETNSRWQIRLYPLGKINANKKENMYLYLEATLLQSAATPTDVLIEFCSVDEAGKDTYSHRNHIRLNVGEKVELPFFRMGGECMRKCLVNASLLLLRITLWIVTGDVAAELQNDIPAAPFQLNNTLTLTLFSRRMSHMLSYPRNCDVTLQSHRLSLPGHKFILASRSPVFKKDLLNSVTATVLTIPNFKTHFVRVFLEHLYTGLFNDLELPTNCYMYESGFLFKVQNLINRRRQEIHLGNVLEVLSCADDEGLFKVKTAAFIIIANIGEAITSHADWADFLHKKTNLALDVLDFLRIEHPN